MPDIVLYIGGVIAILAMTGTLGIGGRWLFKRGKQSGVDLSGAAVAEAQAALDAVKAAQNQLEQSSEKTLAEKSKPAKAEASKA